MTEGNCSFLETESWIRDTVCEASPRSWGEGGLQEFSEQRVGGSVLLMLHGFLLQLTFQQMSYTSHHLAGSKSFVRLRLNAVTSSRTTFARMEPCSPQGSDTLHPRPKPGNEARDPPTRFIGAGPAFGELWAHGFRSIAAGCFRRATLSLMRDG